MFWKIDLRRWVLTALFVLCPSVGWTDAFDISIQGFVVKEEEALTAPLECEFALYDQETGGSPVWSATQTVDVDGGIFNAPLAGDDFPEAGDLPDELFLQMTCDGEQLTPRLAFSAVPFALRAKVADNVSSSAVGSGLTVSGGQVQLNTAASNTWTGVQQFTNVTTINNVSSTELNLLDGKDAALIDVNDAGVIGAGLLSADSLDFTELKDAMTLDAALTVAQGTNKWTQSFTGTTGSAFTYQADSLTTGTALNISATSAPTTNQGIGPIGVNVTYSQSSVNNTNFYEGFRVSYNHNPAVGVTTNEVRAAAVYVDDNGALVGDAAVDHILLLEDIDTAVDGGQITVDNALTVRSLAGAIIDAIDASDPEITNAINVGDNTIVGTTPTIDFTNFDVSGAGVATSASLLLTPKGAAGTCNAANEGAVEYLGTAPGQSTICVETVTGIYGWRPTSRMVWSGHYPSSVAEDRVFAVYRPTTWDVTITRIDVVWQGAGSAGADTTIRVSCGAVNIDCTAACDTAAGTVINCDVPDAVCPAGTNITMEVDGSTGCAPTNPGDILVTVEMF